MKIYPNYFVIACLSLIAMAFSSCGTGRSYMGPSYGVPHTKTSIEEALAELEALPAPDVVSAQLFAELKGALAAALKAKGASKFVSTPPSGDSNHISDLTLIDDGDGTYSISWHYRNVGDYDQNGAVSVSDITPIAMLYGQDAPNTGGNTLLEVVNGSGCGKIGVADITPIAMNFGVSCGSFILEACQQSAGSYTQVQEIPFSAAQGLGRKQFIIGITNTSYKYYRVRACDAGDNRGDPSNFVVMPDPPPPVPPDITSVTPAQGNQGDIVQLSAVVTGDAPLTYAWDFGGGAAPATSSEVSPAITLSAPGDYAASLTVTNAAGQDSFPFTISVYSVSGRGGWWNYRHDAQLTGSTTAVGPTRPKLLWSNNIGAMTYSAVVDTNGRIAYTNGGWYLYVFDASGAEDWRFTVNNIYDLTGTPAVNEDGSFLIGSSDGKLYCLEPGDGQIRWSFPAEVAHRMLTPAIAPDGTIAVFSHSGSSYGSFFLITPEGDQVLQIPATGAAGDIAVGLDGNFYWATSNAIYGYDTAGNQVLAHEFERKATDWIESLAINAEGEIVAQANYSICAYDTGGGLQWFIDAPSSFAFNNAAAIGPNGEVFVCCQSTSESFLRCYDASHTFAWEYPIARNTQCPPIVDGDGKVYAGDHDGNIICLSSEGKLLWTFLCTTGMENRTSPTLTDDGILLVPSSDNNLYAIGQAEAETGSRGPWWTWGGNEKRNNRSEYAGPQTEHLEWRFDCAASFNDKYPTIGFDSTVYVPTSTNKLWAVNPDGTKNWSLSLGTSSPYSTTLGPDGTIYASGSIGFYGFDLTSSVIFTPPSQDNWTGCPMVDDLGRILAMSRDMLYCWAADGTGLWSNPVNAMGNSIPALGADGTIYYADNDGFVWALNPDTGVGESIYQSPAGGFTYGIAVGDDGMLYATKSRVLFCIDPVAKSLAWFYEAPDNLLRLPALSTDYAAYIACYDGNVYKVDNTGADTVFYTTGIGSPPGQCIMDVNGTLYFGAGESVLAIKPDGSLLWQHTMPEYASVSGGLAIAADGTLYAAATDNYIYAFRDE